MKNALITLSLALLMSCVTKQNTVANTINTADTSNIVSAASLKKLDDSKLIFINYMIEKTSNGDKNIRFINKVIADGEIRNTDGKYLEEGVSGDLKCYQLDENFKVIESIVIKNPFVKVIEYVDDSNAFQKRIIELDKTHFSVRLQLDTNTKYIAIGDVTNSTAELEPLIKTNIY